MTKEECPHDASAAIVRIYMDICVDYKTIHFAYADCMSGGAADLEAWVRDGHRGAKVAQNAARADLPA
jgi:hypothetical protein